jgi:adenosylcobinamide kinase / adenosylcobinamide-phosphate guanylyltransferase
VSSEQIIPPRLILILGGARSGKSTFAERLAAGSGKTVSFIATATDNDEEMHQRIIRHKASRPQDWHTIEEPLGLVSAVQQAFQLADVALLDCITLWLNNMLLQQHEKLQAHNGEQAELQISSDQLNDLAQQHIEELLAILQNIGAAKTLIVVSNEVGLGIVPAYPLGRIYRDTLGYVNQRLAQHAERVYLMVAGIAVDIKRLHQEASL